jgi:predicted transcriptional regulator
MATAKDTIRELLEQMPDDCSLEDVQYQLYLRQKLERSRLAAAEGRVVSHAEVKERLSKWAGK